MNQSINQSMMYACQPFSSSEGLILILLLACTCRAFVSPRTGLPGPSALHVLPSQLLSFEDMVRSTSLLLAEDSDVAVIIDTSSANTVDAFSDSIVTFDGPIKIMVAAFGVVMIVLVGLKVLADKMDNAINQVLLDFESTLKRFYPQRWEKMAAELEELSGDQRDVKLLTMMEQLQDDEPEFMLKVEEKMKQ
mmetsp:Transcript_15638/g.26151  ORF Transcript_15638/g.26151 Transcript_15638/m.26151 type:complete len:192 (-) Transcript_15638:158-733(-)